MESFAHYGHSTKSAEWINEPKKEGRRKGGRKVGRKDGHPLIILIYLVLIGFICRSFSSTQSMISTFLWITCKAPWALAPARRVSPLTALDPQHLQVPPCSSLTPTCFPHLHTLLSSVPPTHLFKLSLQVSGLGPLFCEELPDTFWEAGPFSFIFLQPLYLSLLKQLYFPVLAP